MKWLKRYWRGILTRYTPIMVGDEHDLPGYLVLSLTSYPPRFPTLALTLRSLLSQDMEPDRIVLWIAREHMDMLPSDVLALQQYGLEIRECPDLGPYKKIVPALRVFPDYFILTADDDVHYPTGWLRRFVEAYKAPREILCQRARRAVTNDGRFAPYRTWKLLDEASGGDVFPTGMAGVLYPPGSLAPETTDTGQFMTLCPLADDVWLYWMAARTGCTHRVIKPVGSFTPWIGSQRVALWRSNRATGNDMQIAALVSAYGMPS